MSLKPLKYFHSQFNLHSFWEVVESYRQFYSHFYTVNVDYTLNGFLKFNDHRQSCIHYIIEIFVVLFYGCFASFFIIYFEYSDRNKESWHFQGMNLITLIIISMIALSGLSQFALAYTIATKGEDCKYGFNKLKAFLYQLSHSKLKLLSFHPNYIIEPDWPCYLNNDLFYFNLA